MKNRLHLDLRPDDQAAEVARLEALGATPGRRSARATTSTWVVLADPDGNEFCVLRALTAEELRRVTVIEVADLRRTYRTRTGVLDGARQGGRGGARRRLRGRARRAVRAARAQRRRQDHHDQDAHHAAAAHLRHGPGARARRRRATRARCAAGWATSSAATAGSTSGCPGWTTCATSPSCTACPPREQKARIAELLELVGLTGREKERVEGYSRGMRQRLHVARGLLHKPEVLFLDEPSHRHRPGRGPRAARHGGRPARRRHDGAADHPLHVRGRRAVRPDRGHRRRPDRRRGHARRAEVPGRRGHASSRSRCSASPARRVAGCRGAVRRPLGRRRGARPGPGARRAGRARRGGHPAGAGLPRRRPAGPGRHPRADAGGRLRRAGGQRREAGRSCCACSASAGGST